MRTNRSGYMKKLLLPCVGYSALAGVATAVIVFLFELAADGVSHASSVAFEFLRRNPLFLPIGLAVGALIGLLAALILKIAPDCRGGGIPTVVVSVRGLVPFSWIKGAFLLPISALLTFLCGVPLGNEGPCVQMGASLGEGTVRLCAGKNQAWRRYIMTGGACAGFAVATGAPIAGFFFAVEEAHRRLSPMIFMTSSISVVAAEATVLLLGTLTGRHIGLFDFSVTEVLPLKYLWVVVPVGIICGICAVFFSKIYRACGALLGTTLKKVPFTAKIICIFAFTVLIGFFSADFVGSGHSTVENLVRGGGVWYILILGFILRALLLMLANNAGVTGGLFVPTLTFGAIIGSLCANALVCLGALGAEYYPIFVVVGMSAFLGAASRIPLTACVFALEVLLGAANVLPVAIAVSVALLIIEAVGEPSFADTVIEAKIKARHAGKTPQIFDVYLTVQRGAFVVDKEIRDILWPPTCTVLSVDKAGSRSSGTGICEGDVLHLHYQTFEPHATFAELEYLIGRQDDKVRMSVHQGNDGHTVPEIS